MKYLGWRGATDQKDRGLMKREWRRLQPQLATKKLGTSLSKYADISNFTSAFHAMKVEMSGFIAAHHLPIQRGF